MTFRIDVLSGPFGPMMAEISPRLTSKETSRMARTPPNESETFSTTRRISPASAAGGSAAELPRRARVAFRVERHDRFKGLDPHPRGEHAFAAVLIGHFGRDVGRCRSIVKPGDEGCISVGEEAAPHLLRTGQLAVVGIELFRQNEEALDLRAGH